MDDLLGRPFEEESEAEIWHVSNPWESLLVSRQEFRLQFHRWIRLIVLEMLDSQKVIGSLAGVRVTGIPSVHELCLIRC